MQLLPSQTDHKFAFTNIFAHVALQKVPTTSFSLFGLPENTSLIKIPIFNCKTKEITRSPLQFSDSFLSVIWIKKPTNSLIMAARWVCEVSIEF